MTEYVGNRSEIVLPPSELESHFYDLQSIVDRHIRQSGLSANQLTAAQIVDLSLKLTRYVTFEVDFADILKENMTLNFKGAGGFVVIEEDGTVVGSQDMVEGNKMSGLFASCYVLVVPSLKSMLESVDSNEVASGDISMSVGIVLDQAVFRSHGRYSQPYSFESQRVVIPLVYGMAPSAGPSE